MKNALLILALLATPVLADDSLEICAEIGKLSETIMEKRQAGVSMAEMMAVAKGEAKELAQTLVIDAYDQPRYQTPDVQRRTIGDFRDKWYLVCVKGVREGQ